MADNLFKPGDRVRSYAEAYRAEVERINRATDREIWTALMLASIRRRAPRCARFQVTRGSNAHQ